jgi:hypothetical protein
MSRSLPSTPNKQAVKKAQTVLKPLVASYGSFMVSWATDTEQIVRLLEHVIVLRAKMSTVENSSSTTSFFLSAVKDSSFVASQLLSSILLEVESSLLQIRTFE